jgi:hypothetical protein
MAKGSVTSYCRVQGELCLLLLPLRPLRGVACCRRTWQRHRRPKTPSSSSWYDVAHACLACINWLTHVVRLQRQALGFDRERAQQALRTTDNNVEAAANRLLNGL